MQVYRPQKLDLGWKMKIYCEKGRVNFATEAKAFSSVQLNVCERVTVNQRW
jgi:hypothetical protein